MLFQFAMSLLNNKTEMVAFHLASVHLFFLVFISISLIEFPLTSHCCNEEDRSALLSFKSSLKDPSNRLSSWQQGSQQENCCNWHGIGCSNDSFRVVSIDLRNRVLENYYVKEIDQYISDGSNPPNTSLAGKFSASLLKLTQLRYLDLAFNNFQESQIPCQFYDLTTLAHLDLSLSNFSSSISTQFTNISSLQFLDLSCTYYDSITSTSCLQISSIKWLRGLVNLQVLRLSGIDLHEATSLQNNFGEHLSHISNLRDLDLSHCNLYTPIHEFHNLSHLTSLKMNDNHDILSSSFPVQLANLTSLSILELSDCYLHGSVPYLPQLREFVVSYNSHLHIDSTVVFKHPWPKLQKLGISGNEVNGSILQLISNAPLLVSLSASSCSIQGYLPSSFYNLSQLQYLDLSSNSITDDIHSIISKLKHLHFVDLSFNKFHGSLPSSFYNLSQLQFLDLSSNSITGDIPSSISNLEYLRYLDLSNNNFHGSLPSSLYNLSRLLYLDLSYNSITGDILSSISNLKYLNILNLSRNKFHGSLPSSFYNLPLLQLLLLSYNSITGNVSLNKESNLTMIDLSSNMLAGSPVFICNLTHLTDFKLSHNNLTGGFPSCIFELKYLVTIYLSNNKLEGALPPPPLGLNTLVYINLSGNKLSGSIPYSIFPTYPQISTIVSIDLSNNSLSGMIPTNIGYCGSLQNLNLGTNNLTGNFPRGPELEKSLMYLQLSNNHLDGTIHFINTLHRLEFLNLGYNNFGGSIPTSLGSLQDIKYLSLRSNKLIGSIPEEIIHLQKLQILDLSLNNLSGCIPQKLGNWSALINNPYAYSRYLDIQIEMVTKGITIQVKELFNYSTLIDLSCNSLKGSVPKEIGLLKVLSSLNLSHNQLSDGIPEGLGNLSALESLDLSANRLIGQIPQSLTTVHSLGVLNLSYNMLSGKIPRENHFDTLSLDGFAFVGNELLCGFPIEKVCKGDGNTSTSNPTDEDDEVDREDIKDKLLLYAIVALGFAVGFWGLFSVLLMKKQKWWFPYWRFVDSSAVRIVEYIKNN
ncbi:receptor-like protein 9DC3 isoform X1 [Papaver somniferum]|uniref:receptor-like protein 9DC3 isoform X1 n=1 Tax=Papaver somniferum TaxID=3469 RepID=UPI000E6F669B|nr:receptor-like protein 9DC3 isoform X1 [Papaver somniferum]